MSDFFGRLARRALGVAIVAQPAIAPRFAPGPRLAADFADAPAETSTEATAPRSSRDMHGPRVDVEAQKQPEQPEERAPDSWLEAKQEPTPVVRTEQMVGRVPMTTRPRETENAELQGTESSERPAPPLPAFPSEPRAKTPAGNQDAMPRAIESSATYKSDEALPESTERIEVLPVPLRPAIEPAPWRNVQRPSSDRKSARLEEAESPESIVRVNIGRVEVRAVFPDPPPARQRAPLPQRSSLSLSDYLKERDGGMR